MVAKKTGFFVGAVAGAGVAAAALAGVGMRMAPAHAAPQPGVVRTAAAGPMIFAPPPGAPMSFADIFEKVSPAVVSIDVSSRVDARSLQFRGFPFGLGPQGPQNKQGEEGGDDGQPTRPRQQSSGSGFFISADGYIVTNNHVVEGADEITVTLKDGRELKATVVGRDENTDLAVIKVQGSDFTFVNFEKGAKPRVGDWVITVGNPFGLGGTATAGIVSAYGRNLNDDSSSFVDYVQIDAPINRGNSGGPTFDVYGRVIGVNSAIFSPTGGSVGIGFAIPADVADSITKQLISGGKVVRGYIGAQIQNFTPEMAQAMGLEGVKAAVVAQITPGGPAEKAGLQRDDIVLSVNGVAIDSSTALTRQVAMGRAGEVLRLEVIRDGKKRFIDIRSGVRPSNKELASATGGGEEDENTGGSKKAEKPSTARVNVLGMGVAPLDGAARTRYSIGPDVKGVVVETVRSDSDAAEKGVNQGFVITSVNMKSITSPGELSTAVDAAKKAGRPTVLLGLADRRGQTALVPVKID
ncbi:Do family serine endopeptidase [Caulobacter mirabilis]|uniref:Serine protease n=1 Tax=Caulobacter mirabilis TaxID=69666 RepID=A0A2D2AVX7_9CAUL|nr:Do family serine endopeptidase [Caulobacter mirabilis]ATQ42153.1 serine protease [Caulobacter mirabilis]